jgi:GTP-binding protein Era
VLAINKVDRVKDKRQLLPALSALATLTDWAAMIPISGLTGDGLERLASEIRAKLPVGLLYEEDVLTDRPERFFVTELVREAILAHTRQEVPHGVAVQVDEWSDEGGLLRIGVTIVVAKESHKGILIGSKGARLKTIASEARVAIEDFVGKKVFLRSFVKVVPGWTEDPEKVRRLASGEGLA